MPSYSVQFVVIREIVVEATDELQAEKEAYAKLKHYDRDNVIAIHVPENAEGALAGELSEAWRYAKKNFQTISMEWVAVPPI